MKSRPLRCRGMLLALMTALPAVCLIPRPAFAAFNLKIISAQYDTHFDPGEPVTFTIIVRNNETTAQFAEVDVTLSSSAGPDITLVPVITATIPAGQSRVMVGTYNPIAAGIYTVNFPLFDANGAKTDQIRGKFPLHIGNESESLRVFPEAINLGSIPPGRHMFPTPIEVRWTFFRFNRLRQDQPFTIRIYTDNAARFQGIPHALRKISPAGLVSLNGRYVIPLKCWNLNYGPDIQETGWDAALAGPPPVDEDDAWIGPPLLEGGRNEGSASWVRVPDLVDMTPDPSSWRRLIGQDPYDNRFVSDLNPTGDFTLHSPFSIYLATEAGPTAVEGSYATTLVVELWSP